jgi:hypothetical protein
MAKTRQKQQPCPHKMDPNPPREKKKTVAITGRFYLAGIAAGS